MDTLPKKSPILNCRTRNSKNYKYNGQLERSPSQNQKTEEIINPTKNRIKNKVKVITRSKPKWIIDLKSTAYTEPIGSGYEKAIIPYEPCNRPEKSKKDHVPKTTSKPKGLKNNGQPNPYNLRNRSERDLSQNRSNKN